MSQMIKHFCGRRCRETGNLEKGRLRFTKWNGAGVQAEKKYSLLMCFLIARLSCRPQVDSVYFSVSMLIVFRVYQDEEEILHFTVNGSSDFMFLQTTNFSAPTNKKDLLLYFFLTNSITVGTSGIVSRLILLFLLFCCNLTWYWLCSAQTEHLTCFKVTYHKNDERQSINP